MTDVLLELDERTQQELMALRTSINQAQATISLICNTYLRARDMNGVTNYMLSHDCTKLLKAEDESNPNKEPGMARADSAKD